MPSSRSRSEQERAEARRRARYAAQGKEPLPGTEPPAQAATTATAPSPGLLGRIFPPAPPLPGKGDPLKGFTYQGRFQAIVAGAWLVAHHPLAWGVPAITWAVLQASISFIPRQSLVAFGITLVQYGLLIGAGWFGWWRPWLFGAMAGVIGSVFFAGFVTLAGVTGLISSQTTADATPMTAALALGTLALLYALVGAFAGFYGGYLRRRMAPPVQPAKGKRR